MVFIEVLMLVSAVATSIVNVIPGWRTNLVAASGLLLHLYCSGLHVPYLYGALLFYGPIIGAYAAYRLLWLCLARSLAALHGRVDEEAERGFLRTDGRGRLGTEQCSEAYEMVRVA